MGVSCPAECACTSQPCRQMLVLSEYCHLGSPQAYQEVCNGALMTTQIAELSPHALAAQLRKKNLRKKLDASDIAALEAEAAAAGADDHGSRAKAGTRADAAAAAREAEAARKEER